MQPANPGPVQVIILTQQVDKRVKYKSMKSGLQKCLIALGVLQIIIGLLCIAFQGVSLAVFLGLTSGWNRSIAFVGHGFWNGLLFLITGSIGVDGGRKKARCQVIAFNVLSIISATICGSLIGVGITGAILWAIPEYDCDYVRRTTTNSYGSSYYYSDYRCGYLSYKNDVGVSMEAMMAILGLIELVVAICSSAVCCTIGACCCRCGGACCCPPKPLQDGFTVPYNAQPVTMSNGQQQQAIMFGNPQQPMFVPNQQQPMFVPSPQQHHMILPFPSSQQQQHQPYAHLNPEPKDQQPYAPLQQSYTTLQYTSSRDTIHFSGDDGKVDQQSSYYEAE